MRRVWRGPVMVGWVCAVACAGPALDLPASRGSGLELSVEPGEADGWPLSFRGRVAGPARQAVPWLFHGELSDYHDHAVRRGEISATLLERAVPLRFWRESDECLVQPLVWLEPGESYTLALTGHGRVRTMRATEESLARASRFFPPAGSALTGSAVLCGAPFADLPPRVRLPPGMLEASVEAGAFGAPRPDCVTLVVEAAPAEPVVMPPVLGGVLLEPGSFTPATERVPRDPRCSHEQLAADACVEVEDDRIFVTALADSLWLLDSPSEVQLPVSAFQRASLLRGLVPDTELTLAGRVISSEGRATRLQLTVRTASVQRHLVLNEVLANAVGPEPESEWIEVVNDSDLPAQLSGVWLEDGAGRVRLPAERLEPHEIALLVPASSRESSLDVSAALGTRRLELPSLGQRGLSNSGELLQLVGPEGVLSRFPMLPAPHAGRSVARRALDGTDDDPRGFAEHAAPGASPGALNAVE